MKKRTSFIVALGAFLIGAVSVSAHVVVKPAEVGVGSWQTFTMGVPNEKDVAVTGLRLVIPTGLDSVSPNVKPGWTIDTTKHGEGEAAKVTEIRWTGGVIPAGQRDDFVFSAHVPSKAGSLQWNAYQTYEDGTVVSWDQKPQNQESDDDSANTGPYSQTTVVDDLIAKNNGAVLGASSSPSPFVQWLPFIALLISSISLAISLTNRRT